MLCEQKKMVLGLKYY